VEAKLWPFFTEERINLNNPNAQDMFVIYGGYIAPNDPLVKYYAAHTKIKWTDHGHGQLFIDGERFFLKYDYEKMESGGQPFNPAYMLSHGRQGICIDAAIMSCSVLKAKGYPSIVVAGTVKPDLGHSWTETYINGRVYVVDFNRVIPREEAYYSGKYWYVLAKSMSDDDAYQTSYPNITHEYNSEWYKVYV
jgi:hypothetical protein